jgi:hypothetical protein
VGGEAQKIRFHLGADPPEPQRPEPPGVGVWGIVVHMLLMIPLVPSAIADAIVTISAVASLARALGSPTHRTIVSGGAAPTSALLLALFVVVMLAGLALLTWVLVLLARTVLEHRLWRFILLCSLGMLALGVGVWVLTAAGAPATALVFGVYGYVAAVAVGHLLWPHHRVAQ